MHFGAFWKWNRAPHCVDFMAWFSEIDGKWCTKALHFVAWYLFTKGWLKQFKPKVSGGPTFYPGKTFEMLHVRRCILAHFVGGTEHQIVLILWPEFLLERWKAAHFSGYKNMWCTKALHFVACSLFTKGWLKQFWPKVGEGPGYTPGKFLKFDMLVGAF